MTIMKIRRNRFRLGIILGIVCVLLLTAGAFATPDTVQAANPTVVTATCTYVYVTGTTTLAAPYVRVTVTLASNLNLTLAKRVVQVRNRLGAKFYAQLNFRRQPPGTRLIISVGEWNGTTYMQPAVLIGKDCGVRTPIPTATPAPPLPTPTRATDGPTPTVTFNGPQIVALLGRTYSCMGIDTYYLCAYVTWETRNAQRVNLTSGRFDGSTFHTGGEFQRDYLPVNGTQSFRSTTGNDDAQLCAEGGGYWVCRIIAMR